MSLDLKVTNMLSSSPATIQKNIDTIIQCNDITEPKGLSLSYDQAHHLVETRAIALKSNGRIEFTESIITKLIITFSDSTYIDASNYESTLHDLIEIFYYFKNESQDRYSDDHIIAYLYTAFEGYCQGSIELLASKTLEKLIHPEMEAEDELETKIADLELEALDEIDTY
ncbi:DUF6323 family protein [Fusibacter bizertensis]